MHANGLQGREINTGCNNSWRNDRNADQYDGDDDGLCLCAFGRHFTKLFFSPSPFLTASIIATEPRKMCDFKPLEGKILKTVDSVYQDVKNLEECQQRCLTGQYKCHSYDFGDPKSPVCRTSHLDKVALAHIENPYIEIAGAVTYELQNCYDGKCQRQQQLISLMTTA